MRLSKAGSSRKFPRWMENPVPQCPVHGPMEPMGSNWRCKAAGCYRVAAGHVAAPISEAFRDKELRRAGRFVDGDA